MWTFCEDGVNLENKWFCVWFELEPFINTPTIGTCLVKKRRNSNCKLLSTWSMFRKIWKRNCNKLFPINDLKYATCLTTTCAKSMMPFGMLEINFFQNVVVVVPLWNITSDLWIERAILQYLQINSYKKSYFSSFEHSISAL